MNLKIFNLAKKIAQKSPSKFKLGCVIMDKSKIVSVGWNNMTKSHPKCRTYDNYLHAELHALIGLDYNKSKGCDAYVYRETKFGDLAMSMPCPVCTDALRISGIRNVYYTSKEGYNKIRL